MAMSPPAKREGSSGKRRAAKPERALLQKASASSATSASLSPGSPSCGARARARTRRLRVRTRLAGGSTRWLSAVVLRRRDGSSRSVVEVGRRPGSPIVTIGHRQLVMCW